MSDENANSSGNVQPPAEDSEQIQQTSFSRQRRPAPPAPTPLPAVETAPPEAPVEQEATYSRQRRPEAPDPEPLPMVAAAPEPSAPAEEVAPLMTTSFSRQRRPEAPPPEPIPTLAPEIAATLAMPAPPPLTSMPEFEMATSAEETVPHVSYSRQAHPQPAAEDPAPMPPTDQLSPESAFEASLNAAAPVAPSATPIAATPQPLPQVAIPPTPAIPTVAAYNPAALPTVSQAQPIAPQPLPTVPAPAPLPMTPVGTVSAPATSNGAATVAIPTTGQAGVITAPTPITTVSVPLSVQPALATAKPPEHPPIKAVKLALSLGATLIELRGRIVEAGILGPAKVVPVDQPTVGYSVASNWRGLFHRALSLHLELLGDAEIDIMRYNMMPDRPSYLTDEIAFNNIGISPINVRFQLADKLRRELNFLLCLYQRLDTTDYVLGQIYDGSNPHVTLPETSASTDRYNYMITELSRRIEVLLTAWDSYVRERLFAESNTMLMARYGYEAARLLHDLSWSLATKTTPYRRDLVGDKYDGLEHELCQKIFDVWVELFKPSRITHMQRQIGTLIAVMEDDYEARLRQHAPKATASTSGAPSQPAPSEPADTGELDLKSPRASINAIIESIEYWQRTVLEMSVNGILQPARATSDPDRDELVAASWSEKSIRLHKDWRYDQLMDMRSALVEQVNNWISLLGGRQDLTSFRVVSVAGDLIQDYSQDITRLTSKNLQDAFRELQKELSTLAKAGVEATKDVANVGISALTGFLRNRWVLIAAGITVLLIIGIVVLLFATKVVDGGGLIASLLTPVLGALGLGPGLTKSYSDGKNKIQQTQQVRETNINDTKEVSQQNMGNSVNVGTLVLTAAGELRNYLEAAFTKGFTQLQRELGLTSATLAVTSPLVEWVVRHCDANNELEFLGSVIWNDSARKSQLNRIVIAAFGPVGAFMIASGSSNDEAPAPASPYEGSPYDPAHGKP